MKSENGKLNQAISNEAQAMKDYLEIIILGRNTVAKEFSDKFMIQNLSYGYVPNTIRNIRQRLYDEKIIEKIRTGSRGEKFYKIKDVEKATNMLDQNIAVYVMNRKHKPKIAFTPSRIIDNPPVNSDSYFHLKLKDDPKIMGQYPKTDYYMKKICPICSGKLHKSIAKRLSTTDLDRKCSKCKSEFVYHPYYYDKIADKEKREFIEIIVSNEIGSFLK